MRNLKVGAKILLGFAVVITLMIITLVAVAVSSSATIKNSRHIDNTTTLQLKSTAALSTLIEARVQANVLYGTVSDDAYIQYCALADEVESYIGEMLSLIDETPELKAFRSEIESDQAAFSAWRKSIDDIRTLHIEKAQTLALYNETALLLSTVASDAYTSQADTLKSEVYLNVPQKDMLNRADYMGTAHTIQGDILDIRVNGSMLAIEYSSEAYESMISAITALKKRTAYFRDQNSESLLNASALDRVLNVIDQFEAIALQFGDICERVNSAVEAAAPLDSAARVSMEASHYDMDSSVNLAVSDTEKAASTSLAIVSVISAASILAAMVIALLISRSITRPLKFLSTYIKSIADTGDLSQVDKSRAESEHYSGIRDEVGDTVVAANSLFGLMQYQGGILKQIAEKDISQTVVPRSENSTVELIAADLLSELNKVLSRIQDSSSQVSNGARQIASGAQSLAVGSTEQASAIEQLSSTISNVSDQTKSSAQMAARAAELGEVIRQNAEKGSAQMAGMVQAVKEINDASANIGKVIKVIDDIAFQTNILALNAAVEAARAGQHGKGFAVVAGEVRSLAAKSAAAAKDTGSLISNSMEKAQLGAKIAQETSSSLSEIVSGIMESVRIVNDIASSSERQSSEIEHINDGITQVAKVVHQNSATAQESAAAAQQMSSQSEVLAQLASQFKLRDEPALPQGAMFMLEE